MQTTSGVTQVIGFPSRRSEPIRHHRGDLGTAGAEKSSSLHGFLLWSYAAPRLSYGELFFQTAHAMRARLFASATAALL